MFVIEMIVLSNICENIFLQNLKEAFKDYDIFY